MNYYYAYFLVYLVVGLAITAALFLWAVRSGQFRDQKRIRFAPLGGEAPEQRTPATAKWPGSMKLSLALAASGAVSLLVCLVAAAALR